MPFQVKCRSCGFVLQYEVEEISSLEDVAKRFDYKCPRCRSGLNPMKPKLLKIEVVKGEKRGRRAMRVIRYRRLIKSRRRMTILKRF